MTLCHGPRLLHSRNYLLACIKWLVTPKRFLSKPPLRKLTTNTFQQVVWLSLRSSVRALRQFRQSSLVTALQLQHKSTQLKPRLQQPKFSVIVSPGWFRADIRNWLYNLFVVPTLTDWLICSINHCILPCLHPVNKPPLPIRGQHPAAREHSALGLESGFCS
mgnify:CR=1 FL=1